MKMHIKHEPALMVGLLQALLAVSVTFGLSLEPEQVGAIVALATAASAVFLRRQVTPVTTSGETAEPQLAETQAAEA
jgi:hypothetical protein